MPNERLSESNIQHHRGRPWRCAIVPASTLTIGKGVPMWHLLKKTDIEQAKQELTLRRVQILRKHAEESQNLDTERVELEILKSLLDIFALKFMKPKISSPKPIPAPVVAPPLVATPAPIVTPAPVVVPAPVVNEKVRTKPAEVDHVRSSPSPSVSHGATPKTTDHPRGVKAHGSIPAMTRKEGRFNPKASGGGASREAKHNDKHKYPRTNFEIFSRALARELALD
jgi:hypothetical protein